MSNSNKPLLWTNQGIKSWKSWFGWNISCCCGGMWLKVQIDRTINSSSAGTQRHTPHHMYQLKLICVANGVSHPLRAGSGVDIWMHFWNWRDNGNLRRPVWTGASYGRLHLIKSELYHRWWINGQTWVKMSSLFLNKCFYNQQTWGKFANFQNIKVLNKCLTARELFLLSNIMS